MANGYRLLYNFETMPKLLGHVYPSIPPNPVNVHLPTDFRVVRGYSVHLTAHLPVKDGYVSDVRIKEITP